MTDTARSILARTAALCVAMTLAIGGLVAQSAAPQKRQYHARGFSSPLRSITRAPSRGSRR